MENTNEMTQEYMEKMGKLMSEALDTPDGLKSLAAAIAPPISMEIKRKEITSLLLTKHMLPIGETAKYQTRPKVQAYWISRNGQAMTSDVDGDEVEFPTVRISALPMVDIQTLKHGNMGTLVDVQRAAADEIRKKIDNRTVNVLLSAVPPENTVSVTGGELTDDALNEAISLIEDKEMSVKLIVMRGRRFNDMRGWDLDPVTERELRQKGIIKVYGGANILLTTAMPLNEVLIIPDEEFGKYPIRQGLTTETINEAKLFKTGWLAWMEVGHGVTRPDLITKVKILP